MTPNGKTTGIVTPLRKGFAGRVLSWLCLGAFVATLFAPLSVALAADPVLDAINASVCHVAGPDGSDSGAADRVGPHCPLCLIGGVLWVPSSRVPELVRLKAEAEALVSPADLARPAPSAGNIRPASRAPPALA